VIVDEAQELLRRLAASGESGADEVLSSEAGRRCQLDRRTRALVQLSALVADDASTASLRWAADAAAVAGADDASLVRVLATAASATGAAQTVKSAPRLALALDVDIEVEGWDGT
jgi:alkylhydroperoxidase/carboxymuconolactone decarboxylase family protein YurZ